MNGWVREPSVALCAEQCQAKCCRDGVALVSLAEAQRLREIDERVQFHQLADGRMLMDFRNGPCIFLMPDSRCRIYAERPRACQAFPHRPSASCLVWPDHYPIGSRWAVQALSPAYQAAWRKRFRGGTTDADR